MRTLFKILFWYKYHSTNDENYASIWTTDEIPWLFPDFDNKLQNFPTCNKIPWLFPDSENDWNFPDFSLTVATLIWYIRKLICVWINCWVNNREAGDLRRYRAHYDVSVMVPQRLEPTGRRFDNCFTHGQVHAGQRGKWSWHCTATGLDNSIELRMEKIRLAVSGTWVPRSLDQSPAHLPTEAARQYHSSR